MSTQRLLAVILSIGGICWGIFCLPFLFWNPSDSILIFGPGYVVTIGYLVRACSTLSLRIASRYMAPFCIGPRGLADLGLLRHFARCLV